MRKSVSDLQAKSNKELQKEIETLRGEIAKGMLDLTTGTVKDMNAIEKKRKQLAVISTVLREKELVEMLAVK
ncbi:50S ribosomal protein L29 [Candidatus Roizmanbacteria bacterium]|nr:50S ribosomal protein L29 [Candidatus Roizmanbacteria bacterium]